jgi:fatty acid desaturase
MRNRDIGMQGKAGKGTEFRDDQRRATRLPPETVKRLTAIDPAKSLHAAFETLAILTAAISAALVWWTPWVVIPAIIVIAGRQQACFVLAHDAAHYRMFKNRGLNDAVGRAFAVIVGISMCTYRVLHRLHHNHLYEDRDPDTPLHGGYPRGRAYLAKKLAKDLLGLTAYKTYSYFFGAPAINDDAESSKRPLDDTSPALRKAARQDRWIVVAFHITVPVIAFSTGYGIEYLILWILPLVTVLQALLRFRAICEHGAVTDLSSPLTAARTNLAPWWLRWWMFPHHVNFHVEHHLYPSIPHYNLPECHEEMARLGLLETAEVRNIFATTQRILAPKTASQPASSLGNATP